MPLNKIQFKPRFLLISLGNPLPEYPVLHSAGHYVLNGLVKGLNNPPFQEGRMGRSQKCQVSIGEKYTLVQSPCVMNWSGQFVGECWKHICKTATAKAYSLVIVHDELEQDLGVVSLVAWGRSARGHKGVKHCQNRLYESAYANSYFSRISVGIGRPEERDRRTVGNYVLRNIRQAEKDVFENDCTTGVIEKLNQLEEHWQLRRIMRRQENYARRTEAQ